MNPRFKLAVSLQRQGRIGEAEVIYREVAEASPDWRPAWVLGNLGIIYRTTGRLQDAEHVLRRALAAEPENPSVRLCLGFTLLQQGRYPEGWMHYEARHELELRRRSSLPEWRGEPLTGRHVMVLPEQGFGDQILVSRLIPKLAEEAAHVTVVTSPPLVPLFAHFPADVLPLGAPIPTRPDTWISMCSLPDRLGLEPSIAPAPPQCGSPAPKGVGLMLGGNAQNPNPARLPPPDVAAAIRELTDFSDLDPAATGATDFLETARLIGALEAVVTVDTAVAHLAGTMGRPCLILAPRPAADWYTRWDSAETPWYPSVRVARQPAPGDWASLIPEVETFLSEALAPARKAGLA